MSLFIVKLYNPPLLLKKIINKSTYLVAMARVTTQMMLFLRIDSACVCWDAVSFTIHRHDMNL